MRGIDSYTLNTVAGWVLGTGLLVFGLNALAEAVYHAEAPEQPGMVVEIAQQTPAADGAETGEVADIAALLASADPAEGESAARACQACHTLDQGGANKVGPNLWNIVGRQIAQAEGYAYSDALQAKSGETWTFEALNDFIHNPRGYAPGTKMAYGGMQRDAQRAGLLAYLRTLSESPQPLPEASAEAPQEAAETPEAGGEEPAEAAAADAEAPAEAAGAEAEAPAAAEAQGIAQRLADVDPSKGQAAARACQACHTFDQGGAARVGPNLWGVVGRPIAQAEGFDYSDALKEKSGETWTLEALDEFILNPRGFAPGTKMAFGGMKRDEQRLELLAYLSTLSDEPQPLPQATAEPTQGAAETQQTPAEPAEQPAAEQPAAGEPAAEQPAAGEPAAEQPAAGEPAVEQPAGDGEAQGIAGRIAGVDPEKGKAASRACQACHTFDQGGAARVGPNLWGVVGRPIAQAEGFDYSDALKKKSGETWTIEALDDFILNPRGFAPGTKMAYGGMKRDEQRLELLAFLRTLGGDSEPEPGAEAPQ